LLAAVSDRTLPVASFPYGKQICEVEVDAETIEGFGFPRGTLDPGYRPAGQSRLGSRPSRFRS
jgi:hypothetical protein